MSPEESIAALVEARLAQHVGDRPLVLGLCGAQGSGKSTIAARLATRFPGTAILSLDDLYHTRAERLRLAEQVHPLFVTRGVPGTHDVALGLATIAALRDRRGVTLPRFDKAVDDRAPESTWPVAPSPCRLLIFEGWCVGAVAQDDAALAEPVNRLESEEDADGIWRRYVNATLARDYPGLFAALDMLVLLLPPDWPSVLRWRTEQEAALGAWAMTPEKLSRFVSHYERLTRHMWREMPGRADLTIQLAADRTITTRIDTR